MRLSEAADTLLTKVVASLAICLLSVDHVLQGLILHRGEQPEALSEEGALRRVLLGVG